MRDFFHGWQQTIGVMTLAIALMIMGEWVRSNSIADSPSNIGTHSEFSITSVDTINYWCVAIPLALLSVGLLLGKSRKPVDVTTKHTFKQTLKRGADADAG